MSRKIILTILLLALGALVIGACSAPAVAPTPTQTPLPPGQILPTNGTPASTATQAPVPTVAPPQATPVPGDDLAQALGAGRLLVGTSLDNPPYDQYDENFRPDGFDVALMTALAQRLDLQAEFNDFAFEGVLGASAALELLWRARSLRCPAGHGTQRTWRARSCRLPRTSGWVRELRDHGPDDLGRGVADHAPLIDCRTLETWPPPLPAGTVAVVVPSTRPHGAICGFAYNAPGPVELRAPLPCTARRHARPIRGFGAPSTLTYRRAHVITENDALQACDAMAAGDAAVLGRLLDASLRQPAGRLEAQPRAERHRGGGPGSPGMFGCAATGAGFAAARSRWWLRAGERISWCTPSRWHCGHRSGPARCAARRMGLRRARRRCRGEDGRPEDAGAILRHGARRRYHRPVVT